MSRTPAERRDVLVHEDAQVDLALVARGVELARRDDRTYVRQIAARLERVGLVLLRRTAHLPRTTW